MGRETASKLTIDIRVERTDAMFYIISQRGQRIIDIADARPTQEGLAKLAQEVQLDLYVIEGERAGIEYTRSEPKVSARTLAMMAGLDMSIVDGPED
jgi:hypothetical protein